MIRRLGLALALCWTATVAPAQSDDSEAFVTANLLGILYHELGHALIDVLQLPVFGQEEDAADVASILLIDALFDEESAMDIAYDAALGFWAESVARQDAGYDIAFWDVHGPDLQRFYNAVCLFYGANPDERVEIAEDFELPEERAETCEEEFELALDSWGPALEEIAETAPGTSIIYRGGADSLTEQVIAEEVAALNRDFVLPEKLLITVESCGEANAFYDPQTVEIIMCTEFEDWLRELANLPG